MARAIPDLAIDAALSGVLQQGGTAVYTVTVTNVGTAPTPGGFEGAYRVSLVPPAELAITDIVAEPDWRCNVGGICWRLTPLAPGESAPAITVTTRVSAPAGTSVVYSPSVRLLLGDPNLSNNTATITSNVVP